MKIIKIILVLVAIVSFQTGYAQCDAIAAMCNNHMTSDFISDGQLYRAFLLDEEVAEFHATFFGGTTYRIAGCSGKNDGNLIIRVFDGERNQLFTNEDHEAAPYWDFEVTNSLDCIIEAQLDPNSLSSGCAVMLIGFRQ